MRGLLSGFAACGLVLLVACATSATRPMHFVAEARREPSTAVAGNCSVYVRRIEDQRDSVEGFGSSPNLELFARHIPDWVKSAVTSLESTQGKVVALTDGNARQDGLVVTVRIHKAYIHSMATSRTAHVVLSNQYEGGGRVLGTEVYRGSDTSVNWSNSADEVEAAMNTAMNLALAAMGKDVDRYCKRLSSQS